MPAVSKALALEYTANNIRFNTVAPGVINPPKHANDSHEALAKFHPLARMREASDVVDAILYLQNATFVKQGKGGTCWPVGLVVIACFKFLCKNPCNSAPLSRMGLCPGSGYGRGSERRRDLRRGVALA